MFCPNCGTPNPDTATTCSKCGFSLKGAAAPKFKGTMLMVNAPPNAAPRPGGSVPSPAAPAPAAPAPLAPPQGAPQAQQPYQPQPYQAPAAPSPAFGTGPGQYGAGVGTPPPGPNYGTPPGTAVPGTPYPGMAGPVGPQGGGLGVKPQLKGTMLGVAPLALTPQGGMAAPQQPAPPAMPPQGMAPQQGMGLPQGFDPLAGTMPAEGVGYGPGPGGPAGGYGPPPGQQPAYGGGQPAYGPGPGPQGYGQSSSGPQDFGAQPGPQVGLAQFGPAPVGAVPAGGGYGSDPGGMGLTLPSTPPGSLIATGPVGPVRNWMMVAFLSYCCGGLGAVYYLWTFAKELNAFRQQSDVNFIMLLFWVGFLSFPEKVLDAKRLAGVSSPSASSGIAYMFLWPILLTKDLNEIYQAAGPRN